MMCVLSKCPFDGSPALKIKDEAAFFGKDSRLLLVDNSAMGKPNAMHNNLCFYSFSLCLRQHKPTQKVTTMHFTCKLTHSFTTWLSRVTLSQPYTKALIMRVLWYPFEHPASATVPRLVGAKDMLGQRNIESYSTSQKNFTRPDDGLPLNDL